MLSKDEIKEKLYHLKPIFAKEHVKLLGFFGSYARDEATIHSDIDILIETTPEFLEKYRGFVAFSKLEELKNILQNSLKSKIDIVDKKALERNKDKHILKKSIYV